MTKVVILAGGLGTRLAEETEVKPKPMVEIGGRPILWHIMKGYARHGVEQFFVALGYKGDVIKRYFLEYHAMRRDMTIELATGRVKKHKTECENWSVHLIDTGLETMTGGRIKRLESWLKDETFMVTYGDGVSDVNVPALLKFHKEQGCIGTITTTRLMSRFGGVVLDGNHVGEFTEKPKLGEGWINSGFMVFEPTLFDYLADDKTILEADVLLRLARDHQLAAYRHEGFWQCMDNIREKRLLEQLWQSGNAPWKTWE